MSQACSVTDMSGGEFADNDVQVVLFHVLIDDTGTSLGVLTPSI